MRPVLRFSLLILAASTLQAVAATHSLGIKGPNGEQTVAYDVNARGQVAAVLEDEEGNQRGVLFDQGRLTELRSLGGGYSDAKAINDDGMVVGSAQGADRHWKAFVYERMRGMRELGTLGGDSSYGMAINRRGEVVGFADTSKGYFHAFLASATGTMTDLGTLGGTISYASAMNNKGQVVGTASMPDEYRHAFLYDPLRGMVDLGTLGGLSSSASAINDAGVVVGAALTRERRWHAFMHDGKRMIDLGAIIGHGSSFATGINSAGHVVGTLLIGDERQSFVWRDGKMNIHRGGKGLHLANAINDEELVIGATYDKRMDAATMPSAAAPVVTTGGQELTALTFFVIGAGALGVALRRRFIGLRGRAFA
ncbi:MAG TPA: HAF repeat-containing protein [Telluria sp.]|jgi:probable HAF family extracellular repeat protein